MNTSTLEDQYTKLFNLALWPGEPPQINFSKTCWNFGFQTMRNKLWPTGGEPAANCQEHTFSKFPPKKKLPQIPQTSPNILLYCIKKPLCTQSPALCSGLCVLACAGLVPWLCALALCVGLVGWACAPCARACFALCASLCPRLVRRLCAHDPPALCAQSFPDFF